MHIELECLWARHGEFPGIQLWVVSWKMWAAEGAAEARVIGREGNKTDAGVM
jgi:hypothetical protein